jgi:putative membrane protein
MRVVKLIFFLLVLALGSFFGLLNAEPVRLNYYFGSRDLPLSLLLVAMLILGAVFGSLAGLGRYFRLKRELARLRKTLRNTEKELTRTRPPALKDER